VSAGPSAFAGAGVEGGHLNRGPEPDYIDVRATLRLQAQASLVIAMIIPITTNTMIAPCNQIQVGDIPAKA
jgi:hypothetical protein